MKKTLCYVVIALGTIVALPTIAQKDNVGIGTAKPDQSAVLDVSSANKGLLMPRMSLQQRNSIQNPAKGLIVYQTDMISGFYYFDGEEWKGLTNETKEKSVTGTDGDWTLIGNSGTNPTTNFIGTTDNQPLAFRVNNIKAGLLSSSLTFLGYSSGLSNTSGTNNTAYGAFSMQSNTTGGFNVALGANSMFNNTTGVANFGLGYASLFSTTTGNNNVGVGYNSLYSNAIGDYNVAVGNNALFSNTASANMAVGYGAAYSNTSGSNNMALGAYAMYSNTTGGSNTYIGSASGYSATGSRNIFIGFQSGYNETGSDKLYVANSLTATPLIYGDFATKYLAVGEVAAADRAAATSGGYRLLVKGGMITEKIKVAVAGSADWADYVFEPSYKLMSLDKVESYIKENKHLPNVPSAEDMSKNGLDVTQTSAKLMEKIEELTLYMIEMNKEIKALKEENAKLRNK